MGALSNYVTLTITQNSVGITRAGFGVPMILSITAAFPQRLRFYNDIAGVAADFPTTTSAEYLAAQAIFAQSPKPPKIAIGRSALKPTLVASLSAISPTSLASYTYKLTVRGKGVTTTELTFTSDASPTDAEWATLAVAALNGVVGKNYTAAGASSPLTITATNPGDWFSIEVGDVETQKVKYTHADPGVATDLLAITLEQPGWYALITLANSKLYSVAAAAWVESNNRIYGCDSCDSESVITAVGNGDLLDTIKTNAYKRTMGFYHPSPANMAMSALFGRCLPLEPGSVTFFGKSLAGVTPVVLTTTHRNNLTDRRASSYETVDGSGLSVTFGGQVGDLVTGFIDVRRNLDWMDDDMRKGVFGAIVANDIVAFTDAGIAIIESEVRASLTRAFRKGITAAAPGKSDVTVPLASEVSTTDKNTNRRLPNVKFKATMSGAIHSVDIVGSVS